MTWEESSNTRVELQSEENQRMAASLRVESHHVEWRGSSSRGAGSAVSCNDRHREWSSLRWSSQLWSLGVHVLYQTCFAIGWTFPFLSDTTIQPYVRLWAFSTKMTNSSFSNVTQIFLSVRTQSRRGTRCIQLIKKFFSLGKTEYVSMDAHLTEGKNFLSWTIEIQRLVDERRMVCAQWTRARPSLDHLLAQAMQIKFATCESSLNAGLHHRNFTHSQGIPSLLARFAAIIEANHHVLVHKLMNVFEAKLIKFTSTASPKFHKRRDILAMYTKTSTLNPSDGNSDVSPVRSGLGLKETHLGLCNSVHVSMQRKLFAIMGDEDLLLQKPHHSWCNMRKLRWAKIRPPVAQQEST